MTGNFLLFAEAFKLTDLSSFLDKFAALNEIILKAKDDFDDEVLLQTDLLYLEISKGEYKAELYELISEYYSIEELQIIMPNFDSLALDALRILLSYPPDTSQSLLELKENYPHTKNGLMGLDFENIEEAKEECICNEDTWFFFHFQHYHQNPKDVYFIDCLRRIQNTKFNIYFPNLSYSNNLFKNISHKDSTYIWNLFYKSNKTAQEREEYIRLFGAGDKIAIAKELASKIAYRNLYLYDEELSNYNDKNNKNEKTTPYQIFKQGIGNSQIFISTDFEFGFFETYNHRGNHQGEYRFDGQLNPNSQDKSGGHDILVR